jgi:hypothetical protein
MTTERWLAGHAARHPGRSSARGTVRCGCLSADCASPTTCPAAGRAFALHAHHGPRSPVNRQRQRDPTTRSNNDPAPRGSQQRQLPLLRTETTRTSKRCGPRPGGPQSRCPRSWRAEGESGRLDGRAGTGLREAFRNRDSSGVGQLTATGAWLLLDRHRRSTWRRRDGSDCTQTAASGSRSRGATEPSVPARRLAGNEAGSGPTTPCVPEQRSTARPCDRRAARRGGARRARRGRLRPLPPSDPARPGRHRAGSSATITPPAGGSWSP